MYVSKMSDFRERMTRRFLNGWREKHVFYSRMMCHRSLILLMNVFGQVKKCLGSLKSVEMFLSGFLLKTILLLAEYSLDDEWNDQVRYLPLR